MSDNTTGILRKINKKIDEFTDDKAAAKELKAEIKEIINSSNDSDSLKEQLQELSEKFDNLDAKNNSLKESVYEFVSSSTKTLETITKTNDVDGSENLLKFLKDLDKKIDDIAENQDGTIALTGGSEHFKKLKDELAYFQNELEDKINDNFAGINETVTTVITEIQNKMTELQETVEANSETLITNILSDIKQLKSDSSDIAKSIKSVDNTAIKNTDKKIAEVIEENKNSTEQIINEVNDLKKITAKAVVLDAKNKETIETFKNELALLKNNIHTQIRELLSKLVVQDEIKFLCEEAVTGITSGSDEIGVVQKYLRELKVNDERQAELFQEVKELVNELSEYTMNENADKIDIMYENLTMINEWAGNSDKLTENFDILREDFDLNSDKIDIIYENLTFINEWIKTLDKFAKDIEVLKNKIEVSATLPQKIDDISENISVVQEWNKKVDALALQVRALSVQISETESTVNSKNLSDMKAIVAQMSDDMANVSNRTNKLIIESDKANEVLQGHLADFRTLISTLEDKSSKLNTIDISAKVNSIKKMSEKQAVFSEIFTESFTYLAEWIDAAGNTITKIKEELTELSENQQNNSKIIAENKDTQNEQFKKFEDEQIENWAQIQSYQKKQLNKIQEEQAMLFANLNERQDSHFQILSEELNSRLEKANSSSILDEFIEVQNQKIEQIKREYAEKIEILRQEQAQGFEKLQEEQANMFEQMINLQSQQINQFGEQQNSVIEEINNVQNQQISNIQQIQTTQIETLKEEINNKFINNSLAEQKQDKSEVAENLKAIADYLEQAEKNNQTRYEDLSSVVEKTKNIQPSDNTNDIKTIIEVLEAQIANTNANSAKTEHIMRKVNAMEEKINSIENYLSQLVDYLAED